MWHEIEQNTDEWFDLRGGLATSSNFSKIMANEEGAFGEPAKKYAVEIAVEIVTGELEEAARYKNSYMDDGHIFEPIAIREYEMETFNNVIKGGFFISDNKRFGDSPDGNVGEEGCIEVKCVIRTTHFKRLEKGGFDSAYKWQIMGHIWVGNKQWCDFISYCHSMPLGKKLYVHRIERDEDMMQRIEARMTEFWKMVEYNINILKHTS